MSDDQPTVREDIWRPILVALNRFPYQRVTQIDALRSEGATDEAICVNLQYLGDNGLCEPGLVRSIDGRWSWGGSKITTRGIDFLRDDGGLTAQLGIVTVRLEADTIKALVSMAIDQAEAPVEKKSLLKHAIQTLPAEGLKALTGELVKHGLQDGPWLLGLLGKAFSH